MARLSSFGFGARLVAAGMLAGLLASSGVARADEEDDAEAVDDAAPELVAPDVSADEDIEADVDDSAVEPAAPPVAQPAPRSPAATPETEVPDTVLLPSKYGARHGRRPLRPLPDPKTYRYNPAAWERNSPGMMAGGIVLITLGSVTALAGAAMLASGAARDSVSSVHAWSPSSGSTSSSYYYTSYTEDLDNHRQREQLTRAGAACLGVGLVSAIAIGIPLTVVGARKVPKRGTPWQNVEAAVGPTGGTVLVHF
jgi:hypothetical protein